MARMGMDLNIASSAWRRNNNKHRNKHKRSGIIISGIIVAHIARIISRRIFSWHQDIGIIRHRRVSRIISLIAAAHHAILHASPRSLPLLRGTLASCAHAHRAHLARARAAHHIAHALHRSTTYRHHIARIIALNIKINILRNENNKRIRHNNARGIAKPRSSTSGKTITHILRASSTSLRSSSSS